MCVTICGRLGPDEGAVAGYGNRIRAKYNAKWDVQIAGMIFKHALMIILYLIIVEKPGNSNGFFCFCLCLTCSFSSAILKCV
ncbi:MAG: DUF6783 domain-containing protein [Blautia faecis]